MTVFAGAFSLKNGYTLPSDIGSQIRQFISRHPGDQVVEFSDQTCFLAKIDIGAFGSAGAHQDASANVSLLTGEPLLDSGGGITGDRTGDLERLHAQWLASDWSGLQQCRGTFCAVHYSPADRRVRLIADKFGLRPIYYWSGEDVVIFATALRILEELQAVPLRMDLRGATEIACFGFPLAERTAYTGVATIGAGQVVEFSAAGVGKIRYWDWDRLPRVQKSPTDVAKDAYAAFHSAVRHRLHGARQAVAFLSGGLDSRSIVSVLLDQGVAVDTVNFALEGTQDREFAATMARVFATRHHQLHPDLEGMYAFRGRSYNQSLLSRLFESDAKIRAYRRLVWSGDGGSVGVGHVYLNEKTVHAAHSGNVEGAISAFLEYNRQGMNRGIFQNGIVERIISVPRQGIRDELSDLKCSDRGRAFHLFLMLNDQRRHMANFYENIDVDRLEFQMPFFDSVFMQTILQNPVAGFLKHEFYLKWLEQFPPSVRSVPWQAYPGHAPCPLPIPEGLSYQWKNPFSQNTMRKIKRAMALQALASLRSPDFPRDIINRRMMRIASWLTRLGIHDYTYVLKWAAVYCRYSSMGTARGTKRDAYSSYLNLSPP